MHNTHSCQKTTPRFTASNRISLYGVRQARPVVEPPHRVVPHSLELNNQHLPLRGSESPDSLTRHTPGFTPIITNTQPLPHLRLPIWLARPGTPSVLSVRTSI